MWQHGGVFSDFSFFFLGPITSQEVQQVRGVDNSLRSHILPITTSSNICECLPFFIDLYRRATTYLLTVATSITWNCGSPLRPHWRRK